MQRFTAVCGLTLAAVMLAATAGCAQKDDFKPAGGGTSAKDKEVAEALAQLADEDRREAEAQKFCAVEPKNLLGSMGKPFKLTIEGQPVFLCCEGCKETALKDPRATLAKVAEMKRK